MKRTVGGTKWWQVRGLRGVSAEWMCSKKDQVEAKRKAREAAGGKKATGTFNLFPNLSQSNGDAGPSNTDSVGDDVEDVYRAEMDNLKCILYFHGGTLIHNTHTCMYSRVHCRGLLLWQHRPRAIHDAAYGA